MLKAAVLHSRDVAAMRKRRRSRTEWIAICEALDASGDSTADFARRQGLNRRTLGWWRSKLGREGALSRRVAAFVEVERESQVRSSGVVVRIGTIAIEFDDGTPSAEWIADLVARC